MCQLEFWKICIYHYELDNFPTLKDASGGTGNQHFFFYITQNVSTFERPMWLGEPTFSKGPTHDVTNSAGKTCNFSATDFSVRVIYLTGSGSTLQLNFNKTHLGRL